MSSGQKGIMLCERPGPSQMDTSPGPKPFLPSSIPSGLEPLGLVPTQKTFPPSLAPKPANINIKSHATVREIEEENRLATLREEERRMADAAKAENVTAFGAQLRSAILSGENLGFWKATKQAEGVRQSLDTSKVRPAEPAALSKPSAAEAGASKAAMLSFVDDLVRDAAVALESPSGGQRADATADASSSGKTGAAAAAAAGAGARGGSAGGRKGARGAAAKPAWALTSDEVAQLEDAEEEELLRFTDELDFDSFMSALDDAELQESVKAMTGANGKGPAPGEEKAWRKNLVKAMNHAAMKRVVEARRAARDDDTMSLAAVSEGGASAVSRATATSRLKSDAAAAKRSALADGKGGDAAGGWDTSTRAADDVARMERAKVATHEAFDFLRENPELRAVHSPASVRALIGKTEATGNT